MGRSNEERAVPSKQFTMVATNPKTGAEMIRLRVAFYPQLSDPNGELGNQDGMWVATLPATHIATVRDYQDIETLLRKRLGDDINIEMTYRYNSTVKRPAAGRRGALKAQPAEPAVAVEVAA